MPAPALPADEPATQREAQKPGAASSGLDGFYKKLMPVTRPSRLLTVN
jgi:hypothetical protein